MNSYNLREYFKVVNSGAKYIKNSDEFSASKKQKTMEPDVETMNKTLHTVTMENIKLKEERESTKRRLEEMEHAFEKCAQELKQAKLQHPKSMTDFEKIIQDGALRGPQTGLLSETKSLREQLGEYVQGKTEENLKDLCGFADLVCALHQRPVHHLMNARHGPYHLRNPYGQALFEVSEKFKTIVVEVTGPRMIVELAPMETPPSDPKITKDVNSEHRLPQYISFKEYKLWSRLDDDYMKTMLSEVIETGVDDFIEHKWKYELQGYPLPYIRNCTGLTNQQIMEMTIRDVNEVIQNLIKKNPLSQNARTVKPLISTNVGRHDKAKRRIRDCKRIQDVLLRTGMEPIWHTATGKKVIDSKDVTVGKLLEVGAKDWTLVTEFYNYVITENEKAKGDPVPMTIE